MYSSRTRYNTDVYRKTYNLRTALHNGWEKSPTTSCRTRSVNSRRQTAGCPGSRCCS
ncbi:DUF3734 domain-containing protein [Bradyrhizobium quebecense]|nr:DUF3734 domain-containing protein [Bradyrhizobium quebecense]UGA46223.1 DUF3734 domain-containing protein [Bradyrhizobium quebecense]